MRTKPSQIRYYYSLKAKEYIRLEGSPIAIRKINKNWKQAKYMTVRVSQRDYNKALPPFGKTVTRLSREAKMNPHVKHQAQKRLGKAVYFHSVDMSVNNNW